MQALATIRYCWHCVEILVGQSLAFHVPSYTSSVLMRALSTSWNCEQGMFGRPSCMLLPAIIPARLLTSGPSYIYTCAAVRVYVASQGRSIVASQR